MSGEVGAVGVFGGTGFIGSRVAERLAVSGWTVVRFSRHPPAGEEGWRAVGDRPDLGGLDAVINLAGESIARRWTRRVWEGIEESRLGLTTNIVEALARMEPAQRPRVLLNASAVGIYEPKAGAELGEAGDLGRGAIADLCRSWEAAALKAEELGVRVVLLRTGIVFGSGGEAWNKLRRLFGLGLGGRLGAGRQWMPWIHLEDEIAAIEFALTGGELRGPINLSAPEPVTNRDFTRLLAAKLKRPAFFHAPGFALRLVFGGFGETLLDSYRMVPDRLLESGFEFRYPTLREALDELC